MANPAAISSLTTCAQRPRAWERRRRANIRARSFVVLLCSTPEGMGAATTRGSWSTSRRGSTSAQRPRAWERRRPAGSAAILGKTMSPCSTPEGMGAATTVPAAAPVIANAPSAQRPRAWERRRHDGAKRGDDDVKRCSTPEGMGAATTTIQSPPLSLATKCSTPEGMGAATTSRGLAFSCAPRVLNARGHGSGDDHDRRRGTRSPRRVLNARGHGSGDDASRACFVSASYLCSTPEGMGAATTRR